MGPACPTPALFWVPKRLFDKRSHNQTEQQNKRKGGLFYQIYFLELKRHQILINPIDSKLLMFAVLCNYKTLKFIYSEKAGKIKDVLIKS